MSTIKTQYRENLIEGTKNTAHFTCNVFSEKTISIIYTFISNREVKWQSVVIYVCMHHILYINLLSVTCVYVLL